MPTINKVCTDESMPTWQSDGNRGLYFVKAILSGGIGDHSSIVVLALAD